MKRSAALTLSLALAACGGGSGGSATVLAPVSPGQTQSGSEQIHISIPAGGAIGKGARRAKTVSAGANGATIAVGLHGGTPVTTAFDLSPTSPLCTTTAGARVCALAVTAPYGSDDFAVVVYDTAPANGVIPSSAHILGLANLASVTVAPGSTAPIMLTVLQQIGTIGANAMVTFAANGVGHGGSIVINPSDFSNAPIVTTTSAPFANPISVSVTETGGSGHVTAYVGASPAPTTITQSGQTLSYSYDGGGSAGYYATITLSAAGASSQTINIVPMYLHTTSAYASNAGLAFTGPSQGANFTMSESFGSNTYSAQIVGGAACSAALTQGVVTGAGASGGYSISTNNMASGAGCSVAFADSTGLFQMFVPFTNTLTGAGPIQIGGINEYVLPTGNSGPISIVPGIDGNLYVGATTNNIDQFTTAGIGTALSTPTSVYRMIGRPDGSFWFTSSNNKIYRYSGGTTATVYTASPPTTTFTEIANGSDGNVWASDSTNNKVYDIGPSGAAVASYTITAPGALVAGVDGNMYVAATNASALYVVHPTTGVVNSNVNLGTGPLKELVCCASINGVPHLFATENGARLLYVTMGLGVSSEVATPGTGPTGITIGPDYTIWFLEQTSNDVAHYDQNTGTFTRFPVPTTNAGLQRITTGPDGNLWFTEITANKVGVITP